MKVEYPNNQRKDLKEEIRWIEEKGFDFIDLFLEPNKRSIEQINIFEIKSILDITNYIKWDILLGICLSGLL